MSISPKQLAVYMTLLAVGAGAGIWSGRYWLSEKSQVSVIEVVQTSAPINQPAGGDAVARSSRLVLPNNSNFISDAVEKVGPAVVRIDSTRQSTQAPDALNNPLFKRFFGDDETPVPRRNRVERGTGSGFILTPDGRLLTNAHVVAGADTVMVTLKDRRTFTGKVIGVDSVTDVAVIKISATNLPTVKLGRSDNLEAGQWAIAIGNPMGLDNTVTAGIISATNRSSSQVGIPDKRVRFIQTDAAINPGNSGGPLLNDRGEVIGINTAIRADAQGLGFAIPIETAQRIADQLFAKGRVEHPYLGIKMVDLTPTVKAEINQSGDAPFKVDQEQGILILQVLEGSPAAKAKLRPGDIIRRIDGVVVQNSNDVQERVEKSAIGGVLALEVRRDRQTQQIKVQPAAFPTSQAE